MEVEIGEEGDGLGGGRGGEGERDETERRKEKEEEKEEEEIKSGYQTLERIPKMNFLAPQHSPL